MFGSKIPAALSLPQGFNNPAPPKPKFFGQGGTGRAILGSIGDALLQSNNMGPIYAPAMAEQRAMQMAEQNYQRQLRDSLSLYRGRKEIDAQYPDASAPKFWERNDGSLMALGPDGQPHLVYQDPNAGFVDPRTGIFTPFPADRPQIGSVIPDPRLGGSSGNTGGGFR